MRPATTARRQFALRRDRLPNPAEYYREQGLKLTGVMGVFSRSEEAPVKSGNFSPKNREFNEQQRYSDWKFVHSPPGLPASVEKAAPK